MDFRDWIVVALIGPAFVAATVFLFIHPTPGNFGLWCGFVGTLYAGAHIVWTWDSKNADASNLPR